MMVAIDPWGADSLADHPDLSERTYEVIKHKILTGELQPSSRLTVVTLASNLGISRSPIKDALNRLAGEGLVDDLARRGYFVSALDARGISEAMDARLILELASIERGIASVGPDLLSEMRQAAADMEDLVDEEGRYRDYNQFMRKDAELHTLIVSSANNRRLVQMYCSLNIHLLQCRMHFASSLGDRRARLGIAEHRGILAAFEARNLVTLRAAITAHIQGAQRDYVSVGPGPVL